MRPTIRRLLGVAATFAVIAAGGLTAASPAGAAASADEDDFRLRSRFYQGTRALAEGSWEADEKDERFVIRGRLYDRAPARQVCARLYLTYSWSEDEDTIVTEKCGRGFERFRYVLDDERFPSSVEAQVCHWDRRKQRDRSCGRVVKLYDSRE
jgi:hypothetical protein